MSKKCDHTSVGIIIRNANGEKLLIERKLFPFGFAPVAGHVDDHGSFEQAAKDEVNEEVGLTVVNLSLIGEGRKNNKCRRQNGDWHLWRIYSADAMGELKPSPDEIKKVGWYSDVQIKNMIERTKLYLEGNISDSDWEKLPGIEIVWKEWFEELGII